MQRAQGAPTIIAAEGQQTRFEPVRLGKGLNSEKWLQELIHNHPGLMPVASIEPGFGMPIAAAMEVSCGHGHIDNVFLTPTGDIILVEAKLWSNPEARRKVVAQALDYAAALSGSSYQDFETMLLTALGKGAPASLYALIAEHPDALTEAGFIDAVGLNLRRARMLIMVLGDGIHGETQALVNLLQGHAGAHFTFALVEIAFWRDPVSAAMIAIPSTLAQTVMIERGIVRVEQGMATVSAVPVTAVSGKPQSITSELFDEAIAKRGAGLPEALRQFAASLEPLGVYVEQRAALNLKVEVGADKPLNVGYVQKNGQVWIGSGLAAAPPEARKNYLDRLGEAIGGAVGVTGYGCLAVNGSAPPLEMLLPAHAAAWRSAVEALIAESRAASEVQQG
jgi:hypothetical protein